MNKPFVLALIGTSGSGKTTIGTQLDKYFRECTNHKVQFIDGDDIRNRLEGIFGYTKEERNRVRAAVDTTIQYLIDNGISVISAGVNAYEKQRQERRKRFGDAYIQCYVKCSFDECCRRDPKGYYKKYLDGKMKNFDVSRQEYEIPSFTEIEVDTEFLSVEESVQKIINYIENNFIFRRKIVYVPMAADIIHPGHINILKIASSYGRVMVGLFTDEAIESYKRKPTMTYSERKEVIESLQYVDEVVPQDTKDYYNNLIKYRPNYMVHGTDWREGPLSEVRQKAIDTMAAWGGEIVEPEYTKGISSSKIKKELSSKRT